MYKVAHNKEIISCNELKQLLEADQINSTSKQSIVDVIDSY